MKKNVVRYIPAAAALLLLCTVIGCRLEIVGMTPHSSPYDRVWRIAPQYGYGRVFSVRMHGERVPVVMVRGIGETRQIARERAYRQGIRRLGSRARIVSGRGAERIGGGVIAADYIMAIPTSS